MLDLQNLQPSQRRIDADRAAWFNRPALIGNRQSMPEEEGQTLPAV
jgi:hypothetical protein